jgi:hypothetical protein
MTRQIIGLISIFLSMSTVASAAQLCVSHERTSASIFRASTCSNGGFESEPIDMGDDTGWKNQQIAITYTGPGQVCMRFKAFGSNGWDYRPWICSTNGQESNWLWLGDDTGWSDQQLQILSTSNETACFRYSSQGSRGLYSTGLICSSNNQPSNWAWIGDDTGYRAQRLQIRIS